MATVDFTNVETAEFEPVPRGNYLVTVVGCEERPGTEHPYLAVEMEITEEGEYAGRKLWDNMSYSPKALWKLKGFLAGGAGYSEEEVAGEFEIEPDEFIGLECVASVQVKPDQEGVARNRVNRYMSA